METTRTSKTVRFLGSLAVVLTTAVGVAGCSDNDSMTPTVQGHRRDRHRGRYVQHAGRAPGAAELRAPCSRRAVHGVRAHRCRVRQAPAGTVDTLLKPENKAMLQAVLKYHVVAGDTGGQRGQQLTAPTTLQGEHRRIAVSGSTVKVNDATVTADRRAWHRTGSSTSSTRCCCPRRTDVRRPFGCKLGRIRGSGDVGRHEVIRRDGAGQPLHERPFAGVAHEVRRSGDDEEVTGAVSRKKVNTGLNGDVMDGGRQWTFVIWSAYFDGMWRTANGGATWDPVIDPGTYSTANGVRVPGGKFYSGGVFTTLQSDDGASWSSLA